MKDYLKGLKPLPKDSEFKQYSRLRASVLWLSPAMPYVSSFASLSGSHMEEGLGVELIEEINEMLKTKYRDQSMFPSNRPQLSKARLLF